MSKQMEHQSTFARFAWTIVNRLPTTANNMNKPPSIKRLSNIITVHRHPPKIRVTFLPRSTRLSLMMLSAPCLLLQLLTHLNTLCILQTIPPFLQTPISKTMPTRRLLSPASIGDCMQLVKILKFHSHLSKRLLHMWQKPPFSSWMET